ncbi:hypothetical protein ACFRCI_47870 [Streptomyces sp. NPDC056638]|uniref:hypothetical protein n=1 Tax=Streptomyces sp. NPDC056638 TaxID=3345887 RepID=UPI0036A5167D
MAGLIQLAGPFLEPWREADRAAQRARRSDEQQARLDELDAIEFRTHAEEIEFLALSWFTDHADRECAWDWALASAHTQRPINYVMNSQLNVAKKTNPLESHVDELRAHLPPLRASAGRDDSSVRADERATVVTSRAPRRRGDSVAAVASAPHVAG